MSNLFVISDLHLGHKNILKFEHDGKPLRPFESLDEMHETILENWNKTITPSDKVYVLGDVAMKREALDLFRHLNGKKRLVMGNHDLFGIKAYLEVGFQEIYGVRQINGVWLTHCPMHLSGVEQERVKLNIHGHLHANKINHPKYFNASVECIEYTPKPVDEILEGCHDLNPKE